MSQLQAIDVAHNALVMVLTLAGPGILVILIVGVVVSAFQAMTQINETTISFIPKLLALGGVMVALGPWMLQMIVTYTVSMLSQMATVAR